MKTNWITKRNENSTHSVNDGVVTYYVDAQGKTCDEVAALFRVGYDGDLSDGGFRVSDLLTAETEKYAA